MLCHFPKIIPVKAKVFIAHLVISFVPSIAFAQQRFSPPPTLVYLINRFLVLVGLLAVIFIIIGSARLIIAKDNEDEAEKGRKTIIAAVLGLLVIGLAAVIINFVVGIYKK